MGEIFKFNWVGFVLPFEDSKTSFCSSFQGLGAACTCSNGVLSTMVSAVVDGCLHLGESPIFAAINGAAQGSIVKQVRHRNFSKATTQLNRLCAIW